MSALVFREAALSEVESKPKWRVLNYGAGEPDYTPSVGSGGGFAYKWTDSTRFIVWRVTAGALDLVEYSLEMTLEENAIRMQFGQDIVSKVLFHEATHESNEMLVMVVVLHSPSTGKASLKRYCFPHPRCWESSEEQTSLSIFSGETSQWLELSIEGTLSFVAKEVPMVAAIVDEMNVFVGCESGAIVHVKLDPLFKAHNYEESIIKESGPLLSALRGWLPLGQKRQAPAVVGLETLGSLVFALYEDAKLRVWSTSRNNALILSININIESWDPETQTTTSKWGLRLLELDQEHRLFKLGVYVGLSTGDSQVTVFHGSFEPTSLAVALTIEGVSYYCNDRFVDFALSSGQTLSIDEDLLHPRVWALWQGVQPEDGDYILAHTQTSRSRASQVLEVNTWNEVSLNSPTQGLEALISPNPSTHPNIADAFLGHLLQPGRFSPRILIRALQTLTGTIFDEQLQFASIREIRAVVAVEMRKEILNRIAESASPDGTAAPPSNLVWRITHAAWTQYLEFCVQVWKEENTPLALFCVPNSCGLVVVVKLAQLSVLRETSFIESLRLVTPRNRGALQHALLSTFAAPYVPTADNPLVRAPRYSSNTALDLFKTLDVMNVTSAQLGSAKLELFEKRLFNLTDPVASAMCDVEHLFGSPMDSQFDLINPGEIVPDTILTEDEKIARRSFVNRFIRAARAVPNIDQCLDRLLQLVESNDPNSPSSVLLAFKASGQGLYPELGAHDALDAMQSGHSEFFDDALAQAFQQTVNSSFELLRDMLYLALLCIRAELQLNFDSKVLDGLNRVLPRISAQLKAYHVLKWISTQHVLGDPVEAVFQSQARRSAPASPVDSEVLQSYLASGPLSLIRLYIMDMASELSEDVDNQRGWRTLGTTLSSLVRLVHPNMAASDKCSVANQLLYRGQHLALLEYVRLLDTKSAYHRDLMGDCYLALDQYEKAMECFIQTSVNVDFEPSDHANTLMVNPLVHSIRQALGRDMVHNESLGLYYWKSLIPELVSRRLHDMVIRSATAALSCTHPSDKASFSLLYSHIFTSALAIDHHEQAYAALVHIHDDAKRMEALSEFVLTFVERGKGRELSQLPFVNMLDQVHKILFERAKSSDIVGMQPNLYEVLYAFHIAKSNYRLAAEAMFTYAERITSEQHTSRASLERYSAALLSVLSALHLLSPSHAHLVIRRSSSQSSRSPNKRPRDLHSLEEPGTLLSSLELQEAPPATHHVEIYDIAKLEQLHLLAQCNLRLIRRDKSIHLPGLKSPSAVDSTVSLLISHKDFESAYRLASSIQQDMGDIFAAHALYCLQPATKSSSAVEPSERWHALRKCLEKYDTPTTNFHYHYIVADTILKTDNRITLPIWLIYVFKSGKVSPDDHSSLSQQQTNGTINNGANNGDGNSMNITNSGTSSKQENTDSAEDKSVQLMKLYLKHGLTNDAAKLANEMIIRARLRLEAHQDAAKPFQSILPYQYIEQVLLRLQSDKEPNTYLHGKVTVALKGYLDLAVDKFNDKLDLQDGA